MKVMENQLQMTMILEKKTTKKQEKNCDVKMKKTVKDADNGKLRGEIDGINNDEKNSKRDENRQNIKTECQN